VENFNALYHFNRGRLKPELQTSAWRHHEIFEISGGAAARAGVGFPYTKPEQPMEISGTISAIVREKGGAIHSIAPEATVYDAIQVMADRNIGSLLVMTGPRLVGIISERDYTRKIALKGKQSKQTPVSEIMLTPVISVGEDASVEECMELMTKHRIRHLPVLDSDRVVGVVSIGDLINWIIKTQREVLNSMEDFISGKYPG
jgi:CBS domain-containing protein